MHGLVVLFLLHFYLRTQASNGNAIKVTAQPSPVEQYLPRGIILSFRSNINYSQKYLSNGSIRLSLGFQQKL